MHHDPSHQATRTSTITSARSSRATGPKSPLVHDKKPRSVQSRTRGQRWMALLAALMVTLCFAQRGTVHAATIQVNTTQQGITNGQCSLQEPIYASELKASKAISSTDPDTFYATGCMPGSGNDTIVLPRGCLHVRPLLGWR